MGRHRVAGSWRIYHNLISGRGATNSITGLLMYFQNSTARNKVIEAATADRPPNRPRGINVTDAEFSDLIRRRT
jgi:hypothetical protein